MGVELAGDGPTASAIVTQANIHSMHSPDIEDLAGGLLVTISITSHDRMRACCMHGPWKHISDSEPFLTESSLVSSP